MTETRNIKSIPVINAVEGFSPSAFARELTNEDGTKSLYLDVKYRLLWFRLHNPTGKIVTEIIKADDRSAVVACRLYHDKADPEDQYLAKASAQRFMSNEKFGDRYLEIAETAAMGRVLAAAGYGTQFCGAGDLLGDVIADAPVEIDTEPDADEAIPAPNQVAPEATPVESVPATQPAVTAKPAIAQPTAPKTLEGLLNTMSLDDAKNVVVDFGRYAGTKLGEIALRRPADLDWYVKNYAGRNLELKAGAMLLVQAATQKAS